MLTWDHPQKLSWLVASPVCLGCPFQGLPSRGKKNHISGTPASCSRPSASPKLTPPSQGRCLRTKAWPLTSTRDDSGGHPSPRMSWEVGRCFLCDGLAARLLPPPPAQGQGRRLRATAKKNLREGSGDCHLTRTSHRPVVHQSV